MESWDWVAGEELGVAMMECAAVCGGCGGREWVCDRDAWRCECVEGAMLCRVEKVWKSVDTHGQRGVE